MVTFSKGHLLMALVLFIMGMGIIVLDSLILLPEDIRVIFPALVLPFVFLTLSAIHLVKSMTFRK